MNTETEGNSDTWRPLSAEVEKVLERTRAALDKRAGEVVRLSDWRGQRADVRWNRVSDRARRIAP